MTTTLVTSPLPELWSQLLKQNLQWPFLGFFSRLFRSSEGSVRPVGKQYLSPYFNSLIYIHLQSFIFFVLRWPDKDGPRIVPGFVTESDASKAFSLATEKFRTIIHLADCYSIKRKL